MSEVARPRARIIVSAVAAATAALGDEVYLRCVEIHDLRLVLSG